MKRMKKAIVITITLLMLMSGMFGMIDVSTGSENSAWISSAPGNNVPLLTSHAPIRINNDTDFANQAASEGWKGSGTQGDPYIIENYDIDGNGNGTCLYIGNTTVHFIVRNCSLHDASGNSGTYFWNSGAALYSVTGGILDNNTASNNGNGIYLDYSKRSTITNNNASSNNICGIYISSSSSNLLTNNTMVDDGIIIQGDLLEHWNTHSIDTSNTANGKPVYYWKNQTDGTVPAGAGEVILANSTNVIVENQNVSDGSVGIELGFSTSCTIQNNIASNNKHGIYIHYSNNNTIANNTASNNQDGIRLDSSDKNRITNNTASNNQDGIYLHYSSNNNIAKNKASSNKWIGIYLHHSSNNTIANNFAWNSDNGISLSASNNNTISWNFAWGNNDNGISLSSSNSNTIIKNSATSSTENGIYLYYSSRNKITDNTASNNYYGIYLHYSSRNNIADNTASNNLDGIYLHHSSRNNIADNTASNNWEGFWLHYSSRNNITNNTASNNYYGIYLGSSSRNNITNNKASSNNGDGIHLGSSNSNTLTNNTASNNGDGISLYSSSNNTIKNNTASNNHYGIHLSSSSSNTITNNNASNNGDGVLLYYSSKNTMSNNTASNNKYGILPYSSSKNTIKNNTASNNYYGIFLYSSSNNIIKNNTALSNNWNGISITYSSINNTITNNNATSNNHYGIYLHYASSNTVANNIASSNKYHGIFLDHSSNNKILNNIVSSNNYYGIYLYYTSTNIITDNTMADDGIVIWGNLLEHWNTHSIDTSNTVNGKPVYYWKNQTNGTVPAGAGEVILANCSNVIVENQNVSDGSVGIELGFSTSCTIQNNMASHDYHGILLASSNNNTIASNTASSNRRYGIWLYSSNRNTIANNTGSSNYYGIHIYYSSNNTIRNNSLILTLNHTLPLLPAGISLSNSDYNSVINNTVSSETGREFSFFDFRKNIKIERYSYVSGDFTDYLANATWQEYVNTTGGEGFKYHIMGHSDAPDLDLGLFFDSNGDGVAQKSEFVKLCADADADEEVSVSNALNGTYILKVAGFNVTGNPGHFDREIINGSTGIYMKNSGNQCLQGNSISNMGYGIRSEKSGSEIRNSTFTSNYFGVCLTYSNSVIYNNNFINNTNQAYDTGNNRWNTSYPAGGNYWSDYNGTDNNHGPNQDLPGPDGIGDTPYTNILGGSGAQDNYPLMETADVTSPGITITFPSDGAILNTSSVTIYWNGSDSERGINHYEIRNDSGSWTDVELNTSYTFRNLSDGSHTVDVKAVDNASNENTTSVTFTVDTTAPELTIDSPLNGTIFNITTNVTVSWTASDATSGISHYEIRSNSGNWTDVELNTSYTFTELSDDSYTVEVKVIDNASNENTTSVKFTVDTRAPEVAITSPADGARLNTANVMVSWNGSDATSGIDHYEIRIDSGNWTDVKLNRSYTFTNLLDGSHTVDVKAIDNEGNKNRASVTFTVDATAPDITITSPSDGTIFNTTTVTVSWAGSDATSGIDHYEIRIDSGNWTDLELNTSYTFTNLSDGSHTVDVKAVDNASNENTTSATFTVDTTAPEITINVPSDGTTFNKTTVTVSWNSSDATSGIDHYEIRMDSGNWTNVDLNRTCNFTGLSEGSHTVDVRAVDNASNENTTSVNFTVDTTPPTIVSHSPMGNDVSVDSAITVTFSEAMDKSTVHIEINGLNGSIAWNNKTATFTPSQNLSYDTKYSVNITGSDLAGNLMDEYAWSFTTTDTGTISGRVTDKDGHPVAGATVTLETGESATTDANGQFEIQAHAGDHNLTISKDGYDTETRSTSISPGEVKELQIPPLTPSQENNGLLWLWILLVLIVLAAIGLMVAKRKKPSTVPDETEETAERVEGAGEEESKSIEEMNRAEDKE